jgi:hypothetical protein
MTQLEGECSYRHSEEWEEEEKIQGIRSSACPQSPPGLALDREGIMAGVE